MTEEHEDSANLGLPWGAPPPAPLGRSAAYQAVGEVAAPLLAGFSITLVGVIAQGPSTIRWPGAALLLLTVAAASLLFSVQAAFFGRQLYWTRADLTAWYSTGPPDDIDEVFREMHKRQLAEWTKWTERARRSYNAGIVILALGVALVLSPPDTYGGTPLTTADQTLRWCAAGLAVVLSLGELVWWWQSSRKQESDDIGEHGAIERIRARLRHPLGRSRPAD